LILGTQSPFPEGELDLGAWQRLLDVDLPAPDSNEAAGIGHPLAVPLSKGALQIGWFNLLASGVSENFQRRLLPVVAAMMRPVRHPVMIADQVAMKLDRLLNATASFPVIFAVVVE